MSDSSRDRFSPLPEAAPCPFCSQSETELINPFGGQLSVAQYWCRRCRTGFDFMKWESRPRRPRPGAAE